MTGTPIPPVAGLAIHLCIGQRVRLSDRDGQRRTGSVYGLSTSSEQGLMVDVALDEPIIIPATADYREVRLYTQHTQAHLVQPFDERDELLAELVDSMQEVLRISDRDHDAWRRARVAIAKATGSAA